MSKINEEGLDKYRIDDGGLNALIKHMKNGMVIISANRSEILGTNEKNNIRTEYEEWLGNKEDNEENQKAFLKYYNKANDELLEANIRARGYSYSKVFGGYKGSDGVTDKYEPSFVIYCKDKTGKQLDFDDLKKFAIEMCKKYKQDSVYIQEPDGAPNYYDGDGKIVNKDSSKNLKLNRAAEAFFTTVKRKKDNKRFTSDIKFENESELYVSPCGYVQRIRRKERGEILLV